MTTSNKRTIITQLDRPPTIKISTINKQSTSSAHEIRPHKMT
jgi:hypothetical protein